MKRYNLFGLFVVFIGLMLLLNVLGVFVLPEGVSVWALVWPVAILGVGISHIVSMRRITLWGICTAVVGAYFLLANLTLIPRLSSAVILPILLILGGLSIFLPGGFHHVRKNVVRNTSGDGFVSSNAVFGSDERVIAGKEFSGAKIHVAFGGTDLDLTGFESCSDPCDVVVNVTFGGCELRVPADARVNTDGVFCTFGGVEHSGSFDPDAKYTISVSGSVIFGGLEIIYPTVIRR